MNGSQVAWKMASFPLAADARWPDWPRGTKRSASSNWSGIDFGLQFTFQSPHPHRPVESGCGWSLAETSSFFTCPLLSAVSLPPLSPSSAPPPPSSPLINHCHWIPTSDLLPGVLRLLTLATGSLPACASSPSSAYLPTKWVYSSRPTLVRFWGRSKWEKTCKVPFLIHPLRMTCSFPLPLREVSGHTHKVVSLGRSDWSPDNHD